MARQLNGHVSVHSEPGVGSAFTLYLPVTHGVAVVPTPVLFHQPPAAGNETILVIDDEHTVRALVVSVLTRQGYQVLEATSPGDALALMARLTGPVHLVLSDVVLPEMLGPALVAQLRAHEPWTFGVIYMSGYASDAWRSELASGRVPFLAKPFTHTELLHTVRLVLDAASSTRTRRAPTDGDAARQP